MQYRPLNEVITLQRGFDLPTAKRSGGSVPVIGATGIVGWHDEYKVEGPVVTTGRSGVVGGSYWSHESAWPLNTAMYVKEYKGNNPRFIYYALKTIDFTSYDSGSAQPSLNRNYIANLLFPCPPRKEQDRIAGILGSIDDKIEANSRLLNLLSELAIAEVERLDIFSGTPDTTLGEVIVFSPKISKPEADFYQFIDMSVLPTTGAVAGNISQKDTWVGSKFEEGDTLFSRITPCLENGKTAIAMGLGDQPAIGSTEFIVMRPPIAGKELFPYGVARSKKFREIAMQKMTGTSGRQRVKWQDLADIPVNSLRISEFSLGKKEFELMRSLREENISLAQTRDFLIRHLIG